MFTNSFSYFDLAALVLTNQVATKLQLGGSEPTDLRKNQEGFD